MEGEPRYIIKFFAEEGMKGVQIIDRLNKQYGGHTLQRTQMHYWINETKSGSMDLSNIPPREWGQMRDWKKGLQKAPKEDPHLSTSKIAKALNISSTKLQNHLTKSLGMKCYHMRWLTHTLAARKAKHGEMTGSMLQTLESHAASIISPGLPVDWR
jgi:hypothetical protein